MQQTLDIAALRTLVQELEAIIRQRATDLAGGAALNNGGADATAMVYSQHVGHMNGLQEAIATCKAVEDRLIRGK